MFSSFDSKSADTHLGNSTISSNASPYSENKPREKIELHPDSSEGFAILTKDSNSEKETLESAKRLLEKYMNKAEGFESKIQPILPIDKNDRILQFYLGSITVVGLYIVFRLMKK